MTIRIKEVGDTTLKCFENVHGKYKTVVFRIDDLEANTLYLGPDRDAALGVFDECLERFDIDEVVSLNEIEWEA